MLDAFSNIEMTDIMSPDYMAPPVAEGQEEDDVVSEPGMIQDLIMHLGVKEGVDRETYDFQLSLNEADLGFLGFQAQDLIVRGTGKLQNSEDTFTFSTDVHLLRVSAHMVPET